MARVLVAVVDEVCSFPLEEVREVSRGCWPRPLARAPFGCLGAIAVRGELLPLLDLGVLLAARTPRRGAALEAQLLAGHLLVLHGPLPMALVVDRVVEVAPELQQGATRPLSAAALLGERRRRLVQRALLGARR